MTPTDLGSLAYLAGYVDADGCVRFSGGTPRIEVGGVYPAVLEMLQRMFGGPLNSIANVDERFYYRWEMSGRGAKHAMQTLRPWLQVKGGQVDLILRADELPPGPERRGLEEQISALKHWGYRR